MVDRHTNTHMETKSKYFNFVSVCVFVCLSTMISSIFGKSSHCPFPYVVLFVLSFPCGLKRVILCQISQSLFLWDFILWEQALYLNTVKHHIIGWELTVEIYNESIWIENGRNIARNNCLQVSKLPKLEVTDL